MHSCEHSYHSCGGLCPFCKSVFPKERGLATALERHHEIAETRLFARQIGMDFVEQIVGLEIDVRENLQR